MKLTHTLSFRSLLALVAVVIVFGAGLAAWTVADPAAHSQLLYDVFGKTFFSDVYVRFPDGTVKQVSPGTDGTFYQAHISPQGDKVVFFGNFNGPPRIWIADTQSGNVRPLTPEDSGARHPVFSWDGSMIAFASDRGHPQNPEQIELMRGNGLPPPSQILNIWVMDRDGRHARQITRGSYQDQRPAFSPDGKTIAFVSNRGGGRRLWTVSVTGNEAPRQLQHGGWGYRPWYSADGRWIYFFSGVNDRHQICKIPADGGELTPLANDDRGTSHGPFIDYDGKMLLMHSNRSGEFGIWELPLDGSPPHQVDLPGFEGVASHATRSKNGILAFDAYRQAPIRQLGSYIKGLVGE